MKSCRIILFIAVICYLLLGSCSSVPINQNEAATPILLDYYDQFDDIRTRSADKSAHTIVARMGLGYDKGDRATADMIHANKDEIVEIVENYLQTKTAAELGHRNVDAEDNVKRDLIKRINRFLKPGEVKDIIFYEYNIIPL